MFNLDKETTFIQQMGQQAANDGLTRSAGQIWAALLLAPEPLNATELAEELQITKGSISTNIRTLEGLNIVERRHKPGERQDYYAICDDPYRLLIEGQIKRFDNATALVADALTGIEDLAARKKLEELANFYTLYQESSTQLLAALEKANG